jgi:hypothetical protein
MLPIPDPFTLAPEVDRKNRKQIFCPQHIKHTANARKTQLAYFFKKKQFITDKFLANSFYRIIYLKKRAGELRDYK